MLDEPSITTSIVDQVILIAGDEDAAWMNDSLCAQTDPEAFFPDKGGSPRAAKAVCAACPVRQVCLDYALEVREPSGIWGGLTARERRKLLKDQGVQVDGDQDAGAPSRVTTATNGTAA